MRSAGIARSLALLSALIALGQWVVVVPFLYMGSVDADRLYTVLLLAAFLGWPLAGVAAFAAAGLVERRPRAATVLLLLVGLALIFPLFIGGVIALAAAAIRFRSQGSTRTPLPGGWIKAKDVSRAVAVGVFAVVALAILIPTIFSLLIRFRSSDGEPAAAEQPTTGVFFTAEQALRDYADSWEKPFLGACPAAGSAGTCAELFQKSEGHVTYRLCATELDACLTVEVVEKDGRWAISDVENPSGKEP